MIPSAHIVGWRKFGVSLALYHFLSIRYYIDLFNANCAAMDKTGINNATS